MPSGQDDLCLRGLVLALAFTLAGCGRVTGAVRLENLEPPSREIEISTEGKLAELSNGVRLFVVPDPMAGLVAFDVRHHVGARDDPKGQEGLAHYIEHLMFQIDGGAGARIFDEARSEGLFVNATTHPDYTHYSTQGTAADLEWMVRHAGARLQFDCESLADETLARELEVVRNELRGRAWTDAYARGVFRSLFPAGHPYRRALANTEQTLSSLSRAEVCAFVEAHYVPHRTDIVVTGDVEPLVVLGLVKQYVGALPRRDVPPRPALPAVTLGGTWRKTSIPGQDAQAIIAYPMPEDGHADAIAARVLRLRARQLLGAKVGGPESAVQSWGVERAPFGEVPLALVVVEPKPDATPKDAALEVQRALEQGFKQDFGGSFRDLAFDVLRQRVRREVLAEIGSVETSARAYADALGGRDATPRFIGDHLHMIDELSLPQAQALGQRLFAASSSSVALAEPNGDVVTTRQARLEDAFEDRVFTADNVDPAQAHRPIDIDVEGLAGAETLAFDLSNGLHVIAVRSTSLPLIDMKLVVDAGRHDALQRPDVAILAAGAFGIDTTSSEAVDRWNRFLGAGSQLDVEVGPRSTTFSAVGLSIYLDMFVAGFNERTIDAQWESGTLDAWRDAFEEMVKDDRWQRMARNTNRVSAAMYGKGHPLATPVPETAEDLSRISSGDVMRFRNAHYRAGNATLIVSGGFDFGTLHDYVEGYFGKRQMRSIGTRWQRPVTAEEPRPVPEVQPGSQRLFVLEQDRIQTEFEASFPLAQTYDRDRGALLILVELVGLELRRLREELGASYGVYAALDDETPRIVVQGPLDSGRLAESLPAIVEAIAAVTDEASFDRRFVYARQVVLERLVARIADPQQLSEALAEAVRAGRGFEAVVGVAEDVARLRPQDVRTLAKARLDPRRGVTVIRGSRKALNVVGRLRGFQGASELEPVD